MTNIEANVQPSTPEAVMQQPFPAQVVSKPSPPKRTGHAKHRAQDHSGSRPRQRIERARVVEPLEHAEH